MGFEALANDNVTLNAKVTTLKMKAWAAEERLAQEEFAIGDAVEQAVEQVVAKFKWSDKFAALLMIEHDPSYDLGVEEIFFNI